MPEIVSQELDLNLGIEIIFQEDLPQIPEEIRDRYNKGTNNQELGSKIRILTDIIRVTRTRIEIPTHTTLEIDTLAKILITNRDITQPMSILKT